MSPSSNDREWFEQAVVAALPDLFGTAVRLARNRTEAEDIVAETVARGWANLDTLTDRNRLRGWLFRILANTYLSGRRTATRRGAHEPFDEETEERFSLFDHLHSPVLLLWGNPEQHFLDKLLREDLARAVNALPDPFRAVLVLADLHGWTYHDIAATLNIPIGTVRSRLARARGILQKALWVHAQEAGLVSQAREKETLGHD
jgi:RNA polymerase sigma factor (sigma-70 family)